MSLVTQPEMSRKLARIRANPDIRKRGMAWWWDFVKEAEKVDRLDDLSPEFRIPIKQSLKELKDTDRILRLYLDNFWVQRVRLPLALHWVLRQYRVLSPAVCSCCHKMQY